MGDWKFSWLLLPVCKLGRENAQLENKCDIAFKTAKGQRETVNRMRDDAEAAILMDSIKTGF